MTDILPPPEWTAPQLQQLPALRKRLMRQLLDPNEIEVQASLRTLGRGSLSLASVPADQGARLMMHDEHARLDGAWCTGVSAEIADLATQAGRNLPSWKVSKKDVPHPNGGLLLYDKPIAEYVTNPPLGSAPETMRVVGASWGPTRFDTPDADPQRARLWVTFWVVTDYGALTNGYVNRYRMRRAEAERKARQVAAPLTWHDEALLTYGSSEIQLPATQRQSLDPARHALTTRVAEWTQTLRATWLLMQRPKTNIAEVIPAATLLGEQPATGKRARRRQRDLDKVEVVRLHSSRTRQPRATTQQLASDEDPGPRRDSWYSVRFPVSGHIRWQPYPSRGVIDPIFIETFDKGHPDAPYRVGSDYKVFKLDSAPPGWSLGDDTPHTG